MTPSITHVSAILPRGENVMSKPQNSSEFLESYGLIVISVGTFKSPILIGSSSMLFSTSPNLRMKVKVKM